MPSIQKNQTLHYKFLSEKIFDQVKVNPEIPVNTVQDQLQHDLELQISMSKAFRTKAKAEREIRGCRTVEEGVNTIFLTSSKFIKLQVSKEPVYTSPFIDTNSSDNDTPDSPPSQDPYEIVVAQWRSQVAARSSPPSLPIRQILPLPPGLPRRPAVLVLLG
ncbi:hypothetical protein Tco_0432623 [Tanacetum coccineum]